MITIRRSEERGHTQIDWLDSYHTFSFGGYRDPQHMGFGSLRVINDDRVSPGEGFHTHGHRDMEIITVVLEGALEHKDSIGTGSVIFPGDVQKMSAGSGILHSEFNASPNHPVHFLQIWIIPSTTGGAPQYQQQHFSPEDRAGKMRLVASPDGREGSISLLQDANMYVSSLRPADTITHTVAAGKKCWLHVATGSLNLNGNTLSAGDGAAITDEKSFVVSSQTGAECVLFEVV